MDMATPHLGALMNKAAPAHIVDATMFWSGGPGGVARYLKSKQAWIRRHTVWRHTIVRPAANDGPDEVAAPRIPLSGGYRFPLSRSRAAHRLHLLDPDLIEVGDPYRFAWAALDTGQSLGIPVTAFCHSDVEQMAKDFAGDAAQAAARHYLRRLYRGFDAVFAASRWMVGRLGDLGLDNVVHQPLGVDVTTFNPGRRDASWRRRIGLAPDSFVLIYAGRFAPEKHLDRLAAAVDQLGDPYELVMIGQGPVPPRGHRVHVLPVITQDDELAIALASADCFVHAGDSETFGLAVLEALACGTPVVARQRAGVADLIDGIAAVGVERDDPASFAEAIAAMRAANVESLRDAARERAMRWDDSLVFERLATRYLQLADGRPSVRPWTCAYV